MTFEEYVAYFEQILNKPEEFPLYADPEYLNYTKLNWSRMNRWLKRFEPNDDIKVVISGLAPQQWIIITEPWCGDAAHSVPQLVKLASGNPHIQLTIQLRDSAPFLINDYLTNGGKSIPKLIVRDRKGQDLFTWGPRPTVLQEQFEQMKAENRSFGEIKEQFQKWYNEDKGGELQKELIQLLSE